MITKSITYTNEYGNGFEAVVSINALDTRVDLDLVWIAGGEVMTDDSAGVCMTADAALGLADILSHFAYVLREKEKFIG